MMSRRRRFWASWLHVLLMASMLLPASAAQQVNFSFDQADIRLIVKMVGDLTGRRFILDDEVKGKVTVVTPQQIDVGEVYPLLLSILESSGYTVLERTDGIHVVPLAPRSLATGRVVTEEEPAGEGLITKVLRIQHISAVELAKIIEPLVRGGKEGAVSAFGATNHLIITDTADAIRQIEKLIAEIDLPGASRMIEVIRLEHASAEEVARQLEQALEGTSTPGDNVARHMQRVADGYGSLPGGMAVVPAVHANSLVVVGSGLQIAEVKRIVAGKLFAHEQHRDSRVEEEQGRRGAMRIVRGQLVESLAQRMIADEVVVLNGKYQRFQRSLGTVLGQWNPLSGGA